MKSGLEIYSSGCSEFDSHLSTKINNMKNMKKSTGYLIVILFWLVTIMLLSSCGTWKFVEPMGPNAANNHRFNNSICR